MSPVGKGLMLSAALGQPSLPCDEDVRWDPSTSVVIRGRLGGSLMESVLGGETVMSPGARTAALTSLLRKGGVGSKGMWGKTQLGFDEGMGSEARVARRGEEGELSVVLEAMGTRQGVGLLCV